MSQQAVLIKTMFHLFFDDYKLSLQWKKNFFSARKIIPPCGQTDSSQRGIQAFVSGIWKVLSLADHAFLCSWSSQMLVLNAVTIRNFPKAQLHCHCLKTHRPPEMMAFQLGKKKKNTGIFRKGAPPFVPRCQPPVLPPNSKQFGLDTPYNSDQPKETPGAAPGWIKMTWFGHTRDVCVWCSSNEIISKRRGVFLKSTILPLEISSDGGGENYIKEAITFYL